MDDRERAGVGAIARLGRETRLARREIRQGHFQRSLALVAALGSIVSGFEAYTQHQRGAFDDWLMWTPVALTPPMIGAACATLVSRRAARRVLPVVSLAALTDGVVGFIYHLKGIRGRPGGFKLGQYNIVMGPPIFAPLLMSSVGVLGLLASWLRPEVGPELLRTEPTAVAPLATASPLARVEREVAHGRFQQGMALTAALFATLAGGEAYFEHLRGSYNQRVMWTPVWVTPVMVGAAVGAARSPQVARRVLPWVSAVTFLDGALGFFLHLRGVKRMPGSFANLQFNITMGPPLFAPLLFCLVGLLGLIASLMRREEGPA